MEKSEKDLRTSEPEGGNILTNLAVLPAHHHAISVHSLQGAIRSSVSLPRLTEKSRYDAQSRGYTARQDL